MRRAIAIFLMVVFAAAAYFPIFGNGFVYDDDLYVVNNDRVRRGITCDNIIWALSSFEAANWHPLTWLSHMADVSLFGLDPFAHHAVNLLLHIAVAAALMLVLDALTGSLILAMGAALLFAAHPLHVESAAWIAERKDLLCAFFWILALAAYRRYLVAAGFAAAELGKSGEAKEYAERLLRINPYDAEALRLHESIRAGSP